MAYEDDEPGPGDSLTDGEVRVRKRLTRRASWSTRAAMVLAVPVLAGLLLVHLKAILMPLVLAILVAFVLLPFVGWLVRRRVPEGVAILVAEGVGTLPVLGLGLVFASTVGPLTDALPKYQAGLEKQITQKLDQALDLMRVTPKRKAEVRLELGQRTLPEALQQGFAVARSGLGAATTALGYFFLTLVFSAFILLEGRRLREKFAEAFGEGHALLAALDGIGHDVRVYVVAKTLISALTGVCVFVFLELMKVDFALFWGLLAFPLNFIPTVGAVVASVPPILVVLVDPELSTWHATGVVVGLLVINGAIGSVLDPRYVGHRVKLSPLVVFLSMLIWFQLWGPVGAILAVPIMVSIKVICARVPALEPVATLMKG
ncbi:MAG: AI-2E family transporter [Myxococcales bacterium]|nr:AI-2E family transporter [Myxococcales bacterium]